MSTWVQSRAWVANGPFDCHRGRLELADDEIRFVTDAGQEIFAFALPRARLEFPWWLVDGLVVASSGAEHTVVFSNPYAYLSGGDARAVRARWRQAIGAPRDGASRPRHRLLPHRRHVVHP